MLINRQWREFRLRLSIYPNMAQNAKCAHNGVYGLIHNLSLLSRKKDNQTCIIEERIAGRLSCHPRCFVLVNISVVIFTLLIKTHTFFKSLSECAFGFGIADKQPYTRPTVILVAQIIGKSVRAGVRVGR